MFRLGARWRDPGPPHEPSAAERTGIKVMSDEAVARCIAALDRILAAWAGHKGKDWTAIDSVLDERLKVRPARPSLRPPVTPGRPS